MNKASGNQKKKMIMNYVYATIIGLLVVGCAVAISLINTSANKTSKASVNPGEESQIVSAPVYVVPMKNYTLAKDYSGSELQYNETLKQWEIHKAIDFVAGESTDVYAVSDGTVSNIYTNYLEGTVVEITHANGLISVYKSLEQDLNVKTGNKVKAGDKIGNAGETMAQELNQGKHLHFEMKLNGAKVDPNNYIDLSIK